MEVFEQFRSNKQENKNIKKRKIENTLETKKPIRLLKLCNPLGHNGSSLQLWYFE